jgi:hypothetical protein
MTTFAKYSRHTKSTDKHAKNSQWPLALRTAQEYPPELPKKSSLIFLPIHILIFTKPFTNSATSTTSGKCGSAKSLTALSNTIALTVSGPYSEAFHSFAQSGLFALYGAEDLTPNHLDIYIVATNSRSIFNTSHHGESIMAEKENNHKQLPLFFEPDLELKEYQLLCDFCKHQSICPDNYLCPSYYFFSSKF